MRDALNVTGESEETAILLIDYYMDGEEIDVQEEQVSSVADDTEKELYRERTLFAWQHVMEALLERFLTEDVLQDAYNLVKRATQRE